MRLKRVGLAALAAVAVALFVDPAAAQTTVESSLGFFGGVVDFVNDCFGGDDQTEEFIVETGRALWELGDAILW
jgi:hypothetical protein